MDNTIKKEETVLVSIIIPVYDQIEYTKRCVESLMTTLTGEKEEIVIIDNGSHNETQQYLRTLPKNFRIFRNTLNRGFAKACNTGAWVSRGKYLVFLNNDTVSLPNWLAEMVRVAQEESNVGVVGSRLLYPNGTLQHAGVLICESAEDPLYAQHVFYKMPGDLPEAGIMRDYQAVTGACLLIGRDIFFGVGGFNEEYINGYEDIDLCFKVRQTGRRVVYCPSSVLYHHESVSEGRYKHARHNVALLHKHWLGKIKPDVSYDQGRFKPVAGQLTSIIIACLNQVEYTRRCVESIFENTPEPVEIIFVDNGSTDGTGEYLEELSHKNQNVRVIKNPQNLGYGAACNQGMKAAAGSHILLLNNDTRVTEGWLARMLAAGSRFKKVGIIGPRSNEISGAQKIHGLSFSDDGEIRQYALERAKTQAGQGFETNRLIGFCMLLKKEVIEKIGGFDPRFGLGNFEDDDICLRARIAGYKLWVCDDVFIYHKGSITFNGAGLDHSRLMLENWVKFKEKWGMPADSSFECWCDNKILVNRQFNHDLYCPL